MYWKQKKKVFFAYRQIWFIRKHQDNCHDFHFKRKPRNLGTSVKLSVAILACCLELNICLMNFPFPIRNRKQCYKWNALRFVSDACYSKKGKMPYMLYPYKWDAMRDRFFWLNFVWSFIFHHLSTSWCGGIVPSCWKSPSSR